MAVFPREGLPRGHTTCSASWSHSCRRFLPGPGQTRATAKSFKRHQRSRMRDLGVVKRRLVREAFQQNVERPPRIRFKPEVRTGFVLPLAAASFLIVTLVYLSVPSAMVSRV